MDEPFLSLVLPVCNGAGFMRRSLTHALRFAAAQAYLTEIIVSEDGSSDDTLAILRDFGGSIRVLSNNRHCGKGQAVRRGMLAAVGRFPVFTDADLPYGLDIIQELLWELSEGHSDVVIGSRSLPTASSRRGDPWTRRLASRGFSCLSSSLLATGVQDTQCGLKGFRRPVARYLFERSQIDGFAFDVELLSMARARNLRLTKLPVGPAVRAGSTVRILRDAPCMAIDLLRIRRNHRRGYYRLEEGPALCSAKS